jgi:hypothetical protein
VIDFSAKDNIILSGTCTTLQWDVENASRVFLNGIEVNEFGNRQECPTSTTAYTLVGESDGGPAEKQVIVKAIQPYPPPGFVSDMGCNPWSSFDGSTYFSPTLGCFRPVDICWNSSRVDCEKPAADAWCDLYTPFGKAKSWVVDVPGIFVTRYIGSRSKCFGYDCTAFKSITCDISK